MQDAMNEEGDRHALRKRDSASNQCCGGRRNDSVSGMRLSK